MITDRNIELLGNRLVAAIWKIASVDKTADMQKQIDEDFRFKQYLIQRLRGEHALTIAFDDPMSKTVIEHLDKILKNEQRT